VFVAGLLGVLVTLGPPGPGGPQELTPRRRGDLAIHARDILHRYCSGCHDGGPNSRGRLNVMSSGGLSPTRKPPVPFVAPGKPADSQIVQFIEDRSMPPGKHPRPTPDDVGALKEWITAGAPGYPAAFDEKTTIEALLGDVAGLQKKDPKSVEFFRYISFADVVSTNPHVKKLGEVQDRLEQAFRLIGGRQGEGLLEPVDSTATLFRINLHKIGWDAPEVFRRVDQTGVFRPPPQVSAYDVLLLEYPYASEPAENGLPVLGYIKQAKLRRPIPYVRGDWLADALLPPGNDPTKGSPLAQDMRSLTELSDALAAHGWPLGQNWDAPCGTASRPFGGASTVPPVPRSQAARPVLPLDSWYLGDVRPDGVNFRLDVELVDTRDGKVLPSVAADTPFKLKVRTQGQLWFVLLQVRPDGTVKRLLTDRDRSMMLGASFEDVDELYAQGSQNEKRPFRFGKVPGGEQQATEYLVLFASREKLPLPANIVIVKSRHREAGCEQKVPVYRFLFDSEKEPQFDPAKVVRKVIPVRVVAGKGTTKGK
jgi:hypothetical protein